MKIGFVVPEHENLGVEYLSAFLRKAGHEVVLFFDPNLFNTYASFNTALRGFFDVKQALIQDIVASSCDIVGFSVLSDYYGWACRLATEIKRLNPGLPVIFGGVHPTSVPEQVINEPCVDFVCVGEGEEAMAELADRLSSRRGAEGIQNIWFKSNGLIIRNGSRPLRQDLDTFPVPDKNLFYEKYRGFLDVYTIMASRGCPFVCTYCHNSIKTPFYPAERRRVRRRSVASVIEELKEGVDRFKSKEVAFLDDQFVPDVSWLEEFADRYAREISRPYLCYVHPSFVTDRSVSLLERSGCSAISMGIQSTNREIRREILERKESDEQIVRAVSLIKKSKIFLHTTSIFGLPKQGTDAMLAEASFFNENRVDMFSVYWLRYYPKIKIIDIALSKKAISETEVRQIESSKDYSPYAGSGSTHDKTGAKIINMAYLCYFFPRAIGRLLCRKRFYRLVPPSSWLYFALLLALRMKLNLLGKKGTPWFFTYTAKYHLHFMRGRYARVPVPARAKDE